jgi:hypothetical protein
MSAPSKPTLAQLRAVDLLIGGKTDAETASEVDVTQVVRFAQVLDTGPRSPGV